MDYKKIITQAISEILKTYKCTTDFNLSHPDNLSHGDYASNVALILYPLINKQTDYKSPRDLAEAIKKQLVNNGSLMEIIDKVEVAGAGFINFFINPKALIKELEHITTKEDQYGSTKLNKQQTWLLEHTSPNPNKAMHLGHLRNNVTGMALGNIWEFLGIKVILDCVDNNRGIAIAKLMWGYLKFAHKNNKTDFDLNYWFGHQDEWLTPKDAGKRPDRFMDELYVKASDDFKNPEIEKKVRQIVIDWEAEDDKTWALWRKVLDYVYEGQQKTLKRLGSHWDHVWHEHEHYKSGKQFVEEGLKKGIFKIGQNGAIVTNLADYHIPDTVVIKADGTALYITQNLALTRLKFDTYHPDKAFWVVGPEQSLALQQMYAVCEQLEITKKANCTHLTYGYMSIKNQGKMSSRMGNVIYIDDLLDMAKNGVKQIMAESDFNPDELDKISEQIGMGAVKYSILKNGRLVDMAFDLESSISMQGNSGPYIQYTYARCKSVIEKGKKIERSFKFPISNFQLNTEETVLLRFLYRFPEVVAQAGLDYVPHLICTYLYELAQHFNTFYNKHSILGIKSKKQEVENKENESSETSLRLALTQATAQVLKNGLNLLGIQTPERM